MLASFLGNLLRRSRHNARERKMAGLLAEGQRLLATGEFAHAAALLQRAADFDPGNGAIRHRLALAQAQQGDHAGAAANLERVLAGHPRLTAAHVDLGNVRQLQGRKDLSVQAYRRALVLDPDEPAAHYNLGLLLRVAGDNAGALPHLERARELMPAQSGALKELVLCLVELKRFEDAMARIEEERRRTSDSAATCVLRGFVYQKMFRARDAWECYERAAASDVCDAEFFNNRAIVLQDLGRLEEALVNYERALEVDPQYHSARFHRGLARLASGDFEHGWPDYEVRLVSEDRLRRTVSYPRWDGTPIAGRTILVWGEQGLGDEIMFASCLPDLVAAGGSCIIECAPKLENLFRRSFPDATVYGVGPGRSLPSEIAARRIDVEIPAGSLPGIYRRSRAAFPAHRGYLRADAARVEHWRRRLQDMGPGLKVGLSWQGGSDRSRAALRSIPLDRLHGLFAISGTQFVSLQYTDVASEIAELEARRGLRVEHWPDAIADYDETAALVCALDVVVSVCTAVIHLAGALGKPVFIMAPCNPEWRYGFAGDSMPWYPSASVFRQSNAGEWEPVIDVVCNALRRFRDEAKRARDN